MTNLEWIGEIGTLITILQEKYNAIPKDAIEEEDKPLWDYTEVDQLICLIRTLDKYADIVLGLEISTPK